MGPLDGDFAPVDQVAQDYLSQFNMPGLTVVVSYADRIIYAQGYGYADRASLTPTSPWLEYRLASVSKALTATAVMKLYEQGKLQLDAPAWCYVSTFMGAEPKDARLKQVTVRQLLTHTWGLNRTVSPDPVGSWLTDASGKVLTTCADVLRQRLLTMALDFTLTRWIQRLAGVHEPALLSSATLATMFTEQTIPDGTRCEGLGTR